MHEVYSFAILIAASGDENASVVRRRRPSLVRESPLRCLARGPRVPLIAAVSARVCVLALRTLRTTPWWSSAGGGIRDGGSVRAGRRTGHRQEDADRLCAHARTARSAGGDADVLHDDPLTAGHAGLAARVRGDDRGDGGRPRPTGRVRSTAWKRCWR